jgi:hypothetical protein
MQANSVSRDVIAHQEAGPAVAGLVLGVPFTEVRIVPEYKKVASSAFATAPASEN